MAIHSISGAIAMVVGALMAMPAGARMVSGGGSATSDCYAELDVRGIGPDAVTRKKKVKCVDGEPCDSGPCGDGVCDFKVRLCWNQDDPDLAACAPPPRLRSIQLRGHLASVLVMPDELDGPACNAEYVDFPVATRGIRRAGRLHVRYSAKAPPGHVPPGDTDWIRLVCVPRSYEACPLPTSTTTTSVPATTIPGQTTTTATAPETTTTRKTTTTRRRRTTTTTTSVVPTTTTTFVVPTTTTVLPTTTVVIPTTLPTVTITLPATTTLAAVTTTPTTTSTTTTTRRRRGKDDGDDDLIGIDLPLP